MSTTNEAASPAARGGHPNQFALLKQRRFAPFFWVQFLGAGNDNLFKFAFTVMVTYQLQVGWLPPAMAGLVIGAVFILPCLLFSATSGQIADKVDKAWSSTGTRSARPGATWSWATGSARCSARCWASAGCGSLAPCS